MIDPKLYPCITFRQNFYARVTFFSLLFSTKPESWVTSMENDTKIHHLVLR